MHDPVTQKDAKRREKTQKDAKRRKKMQKDAKRPETMAINPGAFQSIPHAAEEDAMSGLSTVSTASTIFDGATNQRLTTVRELLQEI